MGSPARYIGTLEPMKITADVPLIRSPVASSLYRLLETRAATHLQWRAASFPRPPSRSGFNCLASAWNPLGMAFACRRDSLPCSRLPIALLALGSVLWHIAIQRLSRRRVQPTRGAFCLEGGRICVRAGALRHSGPTPHHSKRSTPGHVS